MKKERGRLSSEAWFSHRVDCHNSLPVLHFCLNYANLLSCCNQSLAAYRALTCVIPDIGHTIQWQWCRTCWRSTSWTINGSRGHQPVPFYTNSDVHPVSITEGGGGVKKLRTEGSDASQPYVNSSCDLLVYVVLTLQSSIPLSWKWGKFCA